jgi:hypothetical protein
VCSSDLQILTKPVKKGVQWAGDALVGLGLLGASELTNFVEVNTAVVIGAVGLLVSMLIRKLK